MSECHYLSTRRTSDIAQVVTNPAVHQGEALYLSPVLDSTRAKQGLPQAMAPIR